MRDPNRRWHLAVATDFTDVARQGLRVARKLADTLGARISIINVMAETTVGAPGAGPHGDPHLEHDLHRLEQWAEPEMGGTTPSFVVESGLPGVEISRYAERAQVDLIILVRKARTMMSRVVSGDTVDSVARRSVVPCLLVPPVEFEVERVMAALDGTERGLVVYRRARDLAGAFRCPLAALTVERLHENEPPELATGLPSNRSILLERTLAGLPQRGDVLPQPLKIRRGDVVEQVLAELEKSPGGLLAVGYHRGGPPGVVEAGSIGRKLLHSHQGPVLTVPL